MYKKIVLSASVVSALAFMSGCSTTMAHHGDAAAPAAMPANTGLATTGNFAGADDVPPQAKAGECYARAYVPATYRDESQQVLMKAASEKVDVVPAKFEDGEERVLLKAASKRLEIIPATYETVEERVLVRPASKRIEQVAAEYETASEQVLVKPATQVWKKGAAIPGATTKVDDSGEVLCLVDIPAEYKTVSKQVVKKPATSRDVDVPAEYTTVKKQVVKTPAATREVDVPAEFGAVKVTKLVTPAKETRTTIPAEYQNVTRQVKTSEARSEWRQILCSTNSTPQKITDIQTSLKAAGFNPGRTDGVVNDETLKAVRAYQTSKNLPVDNGSYINMATVKALATR